MRRTLYEGAADIADMGADDIAALDGSTRHAARTGMCALYTAQPRGGLTVTAHVVHARVGRIA